MQRSRTLSIFLLVFLCLTVGSLRAQVATDTVPTSIDPELENILNSKSAKEYIIGGITVTGTKRYDQQLLISIAGINVGDKVMIPGGDNFSKALNNLWNQHLFSNMQIFFTRLEGNKLYIEINVTERPALSKYHIIGVPKSQQDELKGKVGLVPSRVVTENTKRTAEDAIKRYYTEKGFQSATVRIEEVPDPNLPNSIILNLYVTKGHKVRIENVSFFNNEQVSDLRLKKQLKGTKEMTKLTLYPTKDSSSYGESEQPSFREYLSDAGFLSLTKTKEFLDPYFRFKLFSSAKFNAKKYEEDKEKVLEYYNSLGYRDAAIVADTQYYNKKGNMKIDIKVDEGNRYYFGNVTWKGNTKYSDSILNILLGISKGDVYNLDILNKKLGKQMSQEGGDISSYYMDDGYLFFRIEPVETAVYNDTIDFEIRITEGPQATIKNVTIQGNEKLKSTLFVVSCVPCPVKNSAVRTSFVHSVKLRS